MLVKILVVFFCLLLMYQSFLVLKEGFQEGFQEISRDSSELANPEYNSLDTTEPNSESRAMIIAQRNAEKIEYLKQQISSLSGLQKEVKDTSSNVQQLNSQVIALTQQQEQAAKQMVGTEPVQVSGIESSSSENTMSPF